MENKILLIAPPHRVTEPPAFPSGLAYISAVLIKENYITKVLDINGYKYSKEEVKEFLNKYLLEEDINIVGIGCLITCYSYVKWLVATIREIKPQTKVVVGGGLGTSVPEMVLERLKADISVIGEGEETIKEIMDVFNKKRELESLKGIVYIKEDKIIRNPLRERIQDLDSLPFPAWHLFPMDIYLKTSLHEFGVKIKGNAMCVVSARGCPFHCTFCYDAFGHNRTLRSVKNVIEEIIILKEKYGVGYIMLTDPVFVTNKDWIYELCDEIRKNRLSVKWIASGRVNLVDEQILKKMKEAGCVALSYGVESGSQKILDVMKKGVTIKNSSNAVSITRKVGIEFVYSFMMGFPEETGEDFDKTAEFCIENDIHLISIFFVTPYPGTALYEQVKNMGLIKDEEDYISRLGDATELVLNISKFNDDELWDFRNKLIKKVRKAYFKKHKLKLINWYKQRIKWFFQSIKTKNIS